MKKGRILIQGHYLVCTCGGDVLIEQKIKCKKCGAESEMPPPYIGQNRWYG